jgi:hypothetical protein
LIVLFSEKNVISHPKDNIGCKEDYWVNEIEKSKLKIITSSALTSNKYYNYVPKNLLDKDNNTCWCPKNERNGIDQFIIMKIPYGSKGINIINGVAKTRELYLQNNRVKKIYLGWICEKIDEYDLCENNNFSIVFQTIPQKYQLLEDTPMPQRIEFSKIKNFSWSNMIFKNKQQIYLIIGIIEIYKGSKYNDTCISKIEIIK